MMKQKSFREIWAEQTAKDEQRRAEWNAKRVAKGKAPIKTFKEQRAERGEPKVGLAFKLQAQTWGLWVDRFKAEFGFGVSLPLAGAYAEVNNGDSRKRITATRMAAFGPFALAMKKNAGHAFLVFTAVDGRQMTKKVDPKDIGKAIQFAATFNTVASQMATTAANDAT